MSTKTEIGVMVPQTSECPDTLKEAKNDPLLELLKGIEPYRHLDFRLVASRTMMELISVVLSH